jgi:hypothetical protein
MGFHFELKFRTATGVEVPDTGEKTPFLPQVFGFQASIEKRGEWLVVQSADIFVSEEDAWKNGRRLRDVILLRSAIDSTGVEFHLQHEIRVFAGNTIRAEMDGRLTVREPLSAFSDRIAIYYTRAGELTEAQRIAAQLINDSYFQKTSEGRFILGITAVEAMSGKPPKRSSWLRQLCRKVKKSLPADLSQEERKFIDGVLNNAKDKSIGESCRELVSGYLGAALGPKFQELYTKRSNFVHEGQGRGKLNEESNDARAIASGILAAQTIISQPVTAA